MKTPTKSSCSLPGCGLDTGLGCAHSGRSQLDYFKEHVKCADNYIKMVGNLDLICSVIAEENEVAQSNKRRTGLDGRRRGARLRSLQNRVGHSHPA